MTLAEAKEQITAMLAMAGGDADAVERAIDRARRATRERDGYTADDADGYAMLKLALTDVTGRPFRR